MLQHTIMFPKLPKSHATRSTFLLESNIGYLFLSRAFYSAFLKAAVKGKQAFSISLKTAYCSFLPFRRSGLPSWKLRQTTVFALLNRSNNVIGTLSNLCCENVESRMYSSIP